MYVDGDHEFKTEQKKAVKCFVIRTVGLILL